MSASNLAERKQSRSLSVADSDSFVQEVTEEVRRDAMYAAWRKYGPFLVGAIALVILGTAAQSWWTTSKQNAVRDAGEAFIQAQSVEDSAEAADAFLALSNNGEGDYAAMAGLRAGAAFGAAGDVDRAVEQYETVAAMSGVDSRLVDLANLRTVMIRSDLMEPAEMLEKLEPLSAPGKPWRILALEFSAAAHVRAGDQDAAVEALIAIIDDETASPSIQARAREMIAAIGGEVPEPVSPTVEAPSSGVSGEGEDQ